MDTKPIDAMLAVLLAGVCILVTYDVITLWPVSSTANRSLGVFSATVAGLAAIINGISFFRK